jgi:hypothetical protein
MTRPSDDSLRRFLLGTLPPGEATAIAAWVEGEPDAASALRGLSVGDPVTDAVQTANPADPTPTDELDRVIRAVTPLPPEPAGLPPGAVVGGFRVVRELGRGGMGVVYEAVEEALGRRVALKVLAPALAASDRARQRFLREARSAAAVEHDHIVPVYHIGEENGVPFLAMPLLAGRALDDRLADGPLPLPEALTVARQLAEGLAAAHDAGLVHRDVKPSNVWLEEGPGGAFRRVRLLDFGLARAATSDGRLTGPNQLLGTPAYMSPEQARGEDVDFRTDLFSLGAVLYQMLLGRRPFTGPNPLALLSSLALDTPPTPRAVNPTIPAHLSDLVESLLAKDPALRPVSSRAVADELARIPAAPAPARPRPPRRRLLVATALVGLLVVAAGVVVIKVRHRDGTETLVEVPPGGKVTLTPPPGATVTVENPAEPGGKPPTGGHPLGRSVWTRAFAERCGGPSRTGRSRRWRWTAG